MQCRLDHMPKKICNLFVGGLLSLDRTSPISGTHHRRFASPQSHSKVTICNDGSHQFLQLINLVHDVDLAHAEPITSLAVGQ